MKTLLREWTEHHKIRECGKVEDVEVRCQEFEIYEKVIERYAVGKD